jgi:gliding motility-associated-like protein
MKLSALKLFFTLLLGAFVVNTNAQVSIDQTLTPEQLVQDVLLGTGIIVSNVTFNGLPGTQLNNQIARYNGPSNFIGFDDGIVLVSGPAEVVTGGFGGALAPNITGDPDLVQLANPNGTGWSVNNCAVLEFDFIPTGDSLTIKYVFASIEYPGYTCTVFNDPFGFFISGPGISGPFTGGAANIATIPNSNNIPIAVNTVNGGAPTGGGTVANCLAANPNYVADSQYFVNNAAQPAGDIQFPGMTVTLTARAAVVCGETYHIKLAIADVSDGALDSGVFIEAARFASNPVVSINVQPTFNGLPIDSLGFNEGIVEGCTDAELCFVRHNSDEEYTAYFSLGGTAIPGVDYIMPDTIIFFPAGVDTVCIYLSAIADGLVEPESFIDITVFTLNCIGDTLTDFAQVQIFDEYEFIVWTENVDIFCPTDQVPIWAAGEDGVWPFTYEWTLPDMTTVIGNTQEILVDVPANQATYFVTVQDACGINEVVQSVTVTNQIPPAPIVTTTPNDTINCVGQTSTIIATGTFGLPPLTYSWSSGQQTAQITVAPNGSQTENLYTVTVTDACGRIATADVIVYFIPLEAPVANAGDDVTVLCAGDQVTLVGSAIGGASPYSYNWIGAGSGANLNVSPEFTTTYQLQVTDACGGISQIDLVQVIVPIYDPVVVSVPSPTSLCPGDLQTLSASVTGGTGVYTYDWSTGSLTSTTNVSPETSSVYTVSVVDQCGATSETSVQVIVPVYGPITATATSVPVCTGVSITLGVSDVNGGAGNDPTDYTYVWSGAGNFSTVGPTGAVSVTNAEEGIYTVQVIDACGNSAEFDVVSLLAGIKEIPNVITPNGDGFNDKFVVPGAEIFATTLIMHDRWGKVVFETENYLNNWSGSDKKGETYYYIVDVGNGQCVYNGYVHVLDGN